MFPPLFAQPHHPKAFNPDQGSTLLHAIHMGSKRQITLKRLPSYTDLRGRRGETLHSRSFGTTVVAGNETGLQSASPVPSGSSSLQELYTSRFHLSHGAWSNKIFLLFKFFTNIGHRASAFRKTLNSIRPGTSYYLVHLPQSVILPNRHSVGNSGQNSRVLEGRCPIPDKAIIIQYIIHSRDKESWAYVCCYFQYFIFTVSAGSPFSRVTKFSCFLENANIFFTGWNLACLVWSVLGFFFVKVLLHWSVRQGFKQNR